MNTTCCAHREGFRVAVDFSQFMTCPPTELPSFEKDSEKFINTFCSAACPSTSLICHNDTTDVPSILLLLRLILTSEGDGGSQDAV